MTDEVQASTDVAQPESVDLDVAAVAVSDGAYVLFVADFADEDAAWEAYKLLQEVDEETPLRVEGVLVLKRDASGELHVQKVTDPSTRRGLGWGIVGGAVLGLVFPPSILGSVLVLGAAGAGFGKAREVLNRRELEEELAEAIDPGHSGLIALVSDPVAVRVQNALYKADRIIQKAIDDEIAAAIKAEAKAAKAQEKAESKAESKAGSKAESQAESQAESVAEANADEKAAKAEPQTP